MRIERMERYADEVQAQDGQMKSLRKMDNIGPVPILLRRLAKRKANEGAKNEIKSGV